MKFPVAVRYLPGVRPSALESTRTDGRTADKLKPICEACEWYQSDTERCLIPCGKCPMDKARIRPWAQMPRCPANRWPQ